MISWVIRLLYGSTPVEFASSYGMSESIDSLEAVAVRPAFWPPTEESAVGVVSEAKVRLQRVIPRVRNSFKPLFAGRFEVKNGRVVLVGRFTTHWLQKTFMTLWFGVCLLWTLVTAFAVLVKGFEHWWFPLGGLAMICGGLGVVSAGQWFSRNDIAWLSRMIQEALGAAR